MKLRRLKVLVPLLVLPYAMVSCSGCMTQFEAATFAARKGRLLNGRAAVVYSSRYEIDLGGLESKHAFDIHKYRRMAEALVSGGYLATSDFFVPAEVTPEELLLVHTPAYLETLGNPKAVARYLESKPVGALPQETMDSSILRAFRYSTGGTILAARLAMRCGLGINLGGGYHHAHADHGEGFCVYADIPLAVRALQRQGLARRVLVVDLDVHQGNGDARIFAGDEDVFTFDIHEADIYPQPKAKNDLDLPLRPPVDDARYMSVLAANLPRVLDAHKPELVILQGGVDTYGGDPLAHFGLSAAGIVARDAYVVGQARSRGLPVLYVTGGGYSAEAWRIQYHSIANLLEKFAEVRPQAQPQSKKN
jgi:histone deacetylase 11